MPFTPAHTAIVLPLIKRKQLSATALIIGSMAPDFEYFFKMSVSSTHSHTLLGMFYFDLPVTVLLALIFHGLVKRNFIVNLPEFLQRRFQETLTLDFMQYIKTHRAAFVFSALIGIGSHLLWDAFTHFSGYFVQNFSFLQTGYIPFDGVRYPLFYALQHISTALGLFVLVIYILCMQPTPIAGYQPRLVYWIFVVATSAAIVMVRFLISPSDNEIGNRIVSSISGLCLATIIAGFINFRNVTQINPYGEEDSMGASRKA